MAGTTGNAIVRPDDRPIVSNVARYLFVTPDEAAVANARLRIFASKWGRCPRYSHRLKSPGAISVKPLHCPLSPSRLLPALTNQRPMEDSHRASASTTDSS